jgi:zinc protease
LLTNRGLSPGNVFQDTISSTLNNHNFREMVVTPERLNKASLDKAYSFYKDRFADASSFVFTFVGNFDVEVLKPYIEAYLGGLPTINHKETYRNLNIFPPAGQITKIVNKGIGEKASVQLVFNGAYEYNEANNIQIDALEEILQIRLLDRLREKDGGTYSPGVRANYKKIPNSRYSFTISFECAPADVDKLINDALDEVNKLKQAGSAQADIEKFGAEEARSTQVQMKENIFWAGYLGAVSQNQDNPDAILHHVSNLSNITVQSTKDAANKYLSGTNLLRFILLPEKK